MALSTKTGQFSSPTVTGNQATTGIGFAPKALILFIEAKTTNTSGASSKMCFGFGNSSSSRGTIMASVLDGKNPAVNYYEVGHSASSIIYLYSDVDAAFLIADLVSLDSDGFTLNFTTVQGSAQLINYIALGGADLTNVAVQNITSPTSTGNQSYTGAGFQPTAIMTMSTSLANAPPAHIQNTSPRIGIGMGTSSTVREAISSNIDDNGSQSVTGRTQRAKIITVVSDTSGTKIEGDLVSLDATGCTVNWTTVAANARQCWILYLKGGTYTVGVFNQATATGNQAVTGLGLQPTGLILASFDNVSSTSIIANGRFSFGAGNSASSRANIWRGGADAAAISNVSSMVDNATILKMMTEGNASPTTQTVADLVTLDSAGFTINNTTVDATAREIAYFAFGSTAVASTAVKKQANTQFAYPI